MQIEIVNLLKKYKTQTAVEIEKLTVHAAEIVGIVGNNGAGKTTFLRLITDLIKPDTGEIFLDSEKVNQSENWKTNTSVYLDENFLIGFLTPEEYFSFTMNVYRRKGKILTGEMAHFELFMAGEIIDTKKLIRDLSAGNRQKTGIIATLLTKPNLLILDEPFNFLDPASQFQLTKLLLQENKQNNTTILVSSHNIQHIQNICTRILLFESGHIIRDINTGKSDEMSFLDSYFHTADAR